MSKLFITNKIPVSCISQPHLQSQSCVCDGKPIQYFPSTWCIECWWRPWRCQPTLIHIFHICGVLVRTGCCQLWLINVYHSITVFSVPPTHATNDYYLLYGPDPGLYFYCQQNVSGKKMFCKWMFELNDSQMTSILRSSGWCTDKVVFHSN